MAKSAPAKKSPAVDDVLVAEKKGLSFEDGIVLSTTLVLVIAVVLAYLQYTSFYGS